MTHKEFKKAYKAEMYKGCGDNKGTVERGINPTNILSKKDKKTYKNAWVRCDKNGNIIKKKPKKVKKYLKKIMKYQKKILDLY